jgi:hypothetical protein
LVHDTAIGSAFGRVLSRARSCGCPVTNRNKGSFTPVCNGYRSSGGPALVILFCFQPGPFFLASKGFLSAMPDALWFGLTFGVFTAAFFLALGYVYGDARRRDMSAWAW